MRRTGRLDTPFGRSVRSPVLRPHISPALFFEFDNVRDAGRNNPRLGNQ
jgi:hypothetical protein